MPTHSFPDSFGDAALAARSAGFQNLCLTCWQGFNDGAAHRCKPRELVVLAALDQAAAVGADLSPGDPLAAEAAHVIRVLMSKGGNITYETANRMARVLASLHETTPWEELGMVRQQYYRQQIGAILEATCEPGTSPWSR